MRLTKVYYILAIVAFHVLCGLLAQLTAYRDAAPAGSNNETAERRVVLLVKKNQFHPGLAAFFEGSPRMVADLEKVSPDSDIIIRARALVLVIGAERPEGTTQPEQQTPAEEAAAAPDEVHRLRPFVERLPDSIPLLWFAVPPVDERVQTKMTNARVKEFNRQIKRLCEIKANCSFIDLGEQMADKEGHLKAIYHSGDGINFNKRGMRLWNDTLRSLLP